jgi:hypothetical protein
MIERLIAFDTVSRNSNLEFIEFVRGFLDELGVASTLVHDPSGTKANLYATLGPTDRPGIALSGHTSCPAIAASTSSSATFPGTIRTRCSASSSHSCAACSGTAGIGPARSEGRGFGSRDKCRWSAILAAGAQPRDSPVACCRRAPSKFDDLARFGSAPGRLR